mgnify:CR=1 FL=1
MKKNKKDKNFIKIPKYPGGVSEFRNFIKENLKYPKEALKNKIEGAVYVEYEVTDNGEIINPHVYKGIGYGCDEEAIRLVKLLKYEKVSNLGIRVKAKMKTKIIFKLPNNDNKQKIEITYHIKKQNNKTDNNNTEKYYYSI